MGKMVPISSVPRAAAGVNFRGQGVNTSISIFYNKGNLEELALGSVNTGRCPNTIKQHIFCKFDFPLWGAF